MLKQLFIMHPVKFFSKTITAFGKQAGVSVYELDSINDFSYLINDLKPEIILVHIDSVQNDIELFLEQLRAAEFQGFKTAILLEKPAEISQNFDMVVELPIEPENMIKQLKYSIASFNKNN